MVPQDPADRLVGHSDAHLALLARLRQAAAGAGTVLWLGEPGTGKTASAHALHLASPRCGAPWRVVSACDLGPEPTLPELLGPPDGAGVCLQAVDALAPAAQALLAQALQQPLAHGGRLQATSNLPLDGLHSLVQRGRLLPALLQALQAQVLVLPPLRERVGDLDLLARHFMAQACARHGVPAKTLAPDTAAWLHRHGWPGNVRELQAWVQRQVGLCSGPLLSHNEPLQAFQQAKAEAVRLFERDYLQRALDQTHGNVTRAARLAGKERRAFGKLLKKHGIVHRPATG